MHTSYPLNLNTHLKNQTKVFLVFTLDLNHECNYIYSIIIIDFILNVNTYKFPS